MILAIETNNVQGALACIVNPHFAPSATVLEMLRNNKDFADNLVKQAAHMGNPHIILFLSRNNLIDLNKMIGKLLFVGHTYPQDELFIVVETLLNEGADPNKIKTVRPFGAAIAQGHPRIASLFLDRGVDPNSPMTSVGSPLQAAERLGYTELANRIKSAQPSKTRKPM